MVESIQLARLPVETLPPLPCLTGPNYTFGPVIFSYEALGIKMYTKLAHEIMPKILNCFAQPQPTVFNTSPMDILAGTSGTKATTVTQNQEVPVYSGVTGKFITNTKYFSGRH